MRRFFAILVIGSIFLGGCATVKPEFSAYTNIHPVSKADLTREFIDISGRKDASEKIQNTQFTKLGIILHKAHYRDETLEQIKIIAKEKGGDVIIIQRINFMEDLLGKYYGIEAEVLKFK